MINHKNKFIFIHIPKTAGMSVEKGLGENVRKIHKSHNNAHGRPSDKHYAPYWNDDYFKFIFVRNPWDRLVSSYFFDLKMAPGKTNAFKKRRNIIKNLGSSPEGFRTFVREHLSTTNRKKDLQYLPQAVWFEDDYPYDLVCYFEDLQAGFDKVTSSLNMGNFSIPHFNYSSTNSSSKLPYQDYYDEETAAIVADKYSEDIDLFNYSINI